MSVSDVPLLNEYKQAFVKKRLPQTFLGGPNLKLGYQAPCYVYLLQILVWLLPFIVGGICTILTELAALNLIISASICGAVIGCFVFIVQIVHIVKSKHNDEIIGTKASLTASQHLHQLLADDDEIDFDSVYSFTTFKFIFPPLRFRPSVVYHVLFSVALCGIGVWYTSISALYDLYGNNSGAAIVVYVFAWFTICNAQYSLNSGGISPEVASFRSIDAYDVSSLSRAFHVLIFFAFRFIELSFPSFRAVNQVLYILFLFLPLLWLIGLLPPIDSLFLWIAEQCLVFGLGGSPCATDLRLLVSLILSGAVLAGGSFITSLSVLVPYAAAFGFLFSTDFTSLFCYLFYKLIRCCNSKTTRNPSHFNSHFSIMNISVHLCVFLLLGVSVIVAVVYHAEAIANFRVITALEITFLVLFVLTKLLQDTQRVYIIFRWFRNKIYPEESRSSAARSKSTRILGWIFRGVTSLINPILMSTYLSLFLFSSDLDILPFWGALGALHGFRMVWQRSNSSLVVFVILSIIRLSLTFSSFSLGYFDTLHLGTQLLILDICLDRTYKFLDNLWFVVALLTTSWTDKKQRRDSSFQILLLNIIFFPVVICLVGLASALSAPVLPLFTLPIFLVGFPRPSRFWPQTPGTAPASVCADTSHYEKMAPNLVKSLINGISDGKYAMTVGQGTDLPFYIARSQDKTFWIQTLESGFGYVSLSVKGLELQETSCHALEATRLDDACQAAFESPARNECCRTNPHSFLYAVTPIHTEFVDGYSDAKNSLAGIIDYPDAIKQVHHDFMKSLIWLMSHSMNKKNQQCSNTGLPVLEQKSPLADKKTFGVGSPFSKNSSKIQTLVQPMDSFPLPDLNQNKGIKGNEKHQKSNLFQRTSKFTQKENSPESMGSLGSILVSESETSLRKSKTNKLNSKNVASPIPGTMDAEDDLWELDSDLSDSGFGIAVKNVFAKSNTVDEKGKANGNSGQPYVSNAKDVTGWGSVPFNTVELSPYLKLFDSSWYLHVSSLLEGGNSGAEEDELLTACRNVALSCYLLVFVQGVPGRNPAAVGANHITKVFGGEIPWSPELEWLIQRKDLLCLVIQAMRYSVKMMYDRVAMGTVDMAADESHDEIVESLQEYDSSWCISPETGKEWKNALKEGVPSLFSISFAPATNEYSARVLLRRSVETHVCRTSSAAVRGIWANLSLELFYATNDDEERYSIQAHPNLIRNLTVQAADPPLGYPIYSSPPFYANVLT